MSDSPGTGGPDDDAARWIVEVAPSLTNDSSGLTCGEEVSAALSKSLDDIAAQGGGDVELWVQNVNDDTDQVARSLGATAYRDLWQVRAPLPAARSTLETRPFTPDDVNDLIAVNNRAFAWHPEQGGMTAESLAATMAEPWFRADGFRLFEREGELLGFCWTKIHHDMDPVHGEIYVIAIDPSAHGQGLGTPMTLAGLDWIYDLGIKHALLYVESDNDPANATYRKIGFVHHQTNRAYNLRVEPK